MAKCYIGETKRALQARIKEYKVATRRGELEKSAIAEHAMGEVDNTTTLLISAPICLKDTEKPRPLDSKYCIKLH